VSGVVLDGVRVTGKVARSDADIPLEVSVGATEPEYRPGLVDASFDYGPGLIRPGDTVSFHILAPAAGWRYEWLFGDGTTAVGSQVQHAFPDAEGTLLDGSGRFRVLVHATRAPHDEVWVSRSVVVGRQPVGADTVPEPLVPGVTRVDTGRATEYDGWVQIPADGGYSLTLLSSRRAVMIVDNLPPVRSPEVRIEVCGSLGDAVLPTQISAALLAGLHRIRIELDPGVENVTQSNLGDGAPVLLWEGPGILPEAIPAAALLKAGNRQ